MRYFKIATTVVFGLFWAAVVAVVIFGFTFPGGSTGEDLFPDPTVGQAVYDPAGAFDPAVEQALESQVDAIEERSGAELAVYVRVDDFATEESNEAAARASTMGWSG